MRRQAAVKYCGHCNPAMEMERVLRAAAERLPGVDFVPWREARAPEALLVLNACAAGCARCPPFPEERTVAVTPEAVNRWPVPPDQLAETLAEALRGVLSAVQEQERSETCEN